MNSLFRRFNQLVTLPSFPSLSVELLEDRTLLSSVTVVARGEMGVEDFSLLINDQVAATYTGIGTSFQSFTFDNAEVFSHSDIKIEFLNDAYDPEAGVDRNLIVDRLSLIHI